MSGSKCILLTALTAMTIGCGDKKPAELTPFTGKVLLDGKPLAAGQIIFDAADGTSPVVLDVKDGTYEGKSATGPKTVRIVAMKLVDPPKNGMTGPLYEKKVEQNYLPERYNTKSTLKADVKAGGPNDFKFDVTTK